jgi:glycosyltransferase involved in cell wall biosynthesis
MYLEILPRMIALDHTVEWTVILPITKRGVVQLGHTVRYVPQLPVWSARSSHPWRRGARRINRYVQRRAVSRDAIWHSTYYTSPPCPVASTVGSVFDMIYEFEYDRPHLLHSRCALEAEIIIFITECTAESFRSLFGVSRDRCVVIPLAASPVFQKLIGPTNMNEHGLSGRPFFLYVGGRQNAYKNFSGLLHAYAGWPRRTEADLVVVGNAWSTAELQLLEQLRIKDKVYLREHVDDDMLCELYNAAHAFVYPSRYEGFGVPLLESLACECQIVASRIPSTLEVIGQNATYFEPTDTESFVNALDTAYLNPKDAASRASAREWVKTSYSWDKTADMTLDVFRSVQR